MVVSNLFQNIPDELYQQHYEEIQNNAAFRLKKIVSKGHCSDRNEWYDQSHNEWVLLLKGAARIEVEGEPQKIAVLPGDYLYLKAHQRHRIDWTDPDCETVWLSLDFGRNL